MQKKELLSQIFIWEEAKGFFGFLKALLSTCSHILFRPVDFFKQLALDKGGNLKKRLIYAFLFAIILGYIRLAFDTANLYWLKYLPKDVLPASIQWQTSLLSVSLLKSPFFLLRPLIVFVLTFILVMISVKLILGFDKAWVLAFLVVCYKSAADIFYCIPMVGGIFAAIWSLALIIIGVREVYCVNTLRSVLCAVLMPLIIFLFIILSLGPSMNRFVLKLYPEIETQASKLNDVYAYQNTASIISAAQAYKKELGFYPANLGLLKKYLDNSVAGDIADSRHAGGYTYGYNRLDDEHFIFEVRGKFSFYADESGKILLNGRDGRWIQDSKELDRLMDGKDKQ